VPTTSAVKGLALLPVLAAFLVVQVGVKVVLQMPTVPDERTLPPTRPAYSVVVDKAAVHAAPDATSPVIMEVQRRAILYVSGEQQPAWRYVSGVNWNGWVAASDLTPNTFLIRDGQGVPSQ
jgi:hypothetical protein